MLISSFCIPAVLQSPLLPCRCTSSNSIKSKWGSPIPISSSPLQLQKFQTQKLYGTFKTRCSSSATSSSSYSVLEAERNKIKEQLLCTIAASNGRLTDDSMALISSLENLNPNPDITLVPHLYNGCFHQITSSMKGTGKPGEAHKLVENTVTLGRATFNAFKPIDIEVQFEETYNHVGIEAEDAYYLLIQFSVNCPSGDLEGILINKASFSLAGSARLDITFESSTMKPLSPQKDMQSWFNLFLDANPSMDENGAVTVPLPPAKGFHDYLYLDTDLRITKGNRGSVNVVKRLPHKIIHI